MSDPVVSVIMPSLNQADFIRAAIESVLSQDYAEVELIVVDGASTDGSVEIIRSYGERIAWWVSERDAGQSDALNKGFSHASGQILGWLNSDDLLEAGALRRVAGEIQPGRPDWLIGITRLIDAQGQVSGERFGPPVSADTFLEWGKYNFSQQAVFWTREMWNEAGPLRTEYHYVMDLDLWWRMFNIAPPTRVEQILGNYRLHDMAKCVAGRDSLAEEYRSWLNDLLCDERRTADPEKRRELAERLVDGFQLSRKQELELKRLYDHAVIGRVLGLWRRFVNRGLPGPPKVR